MSPSSLTNSILTDLYAHADPKNVEGMARFGIVSTGNILGVALPFIRAKAKALRRNHELALELWNTGIYEARLLAAFIADPAQLTKPVMTSWAKQFDNWAICDGLCIHLFRRSRHAHDLAVAWSKRKEEFVRRAGFVMMATLAVHDKEADNDVFLCYLSVIERTSGDDRNGVRKAVNWALRQIGKRNKSLNRTAIASARRIAKRSESSARWIASDALRELLSAAVRKRLTTRRRPGSRRGNRGT